MLVWQRIEITEVVYLSLHERIIPEFAEHGYDVKVHIAGDEPDHKTLALSYGWIWHEIPNQNIGPKNQALFVEMKKYAWDWQLLLGSDDILLPGCVQAMIVGMTKSKWCQFRRCYFFDIRSGESTKVNGAMGAGRLTHRSLLDKIDVLWDHRRHGCDGISGLHIKQANNNLSYFDMGGEYVYVADIKSDVNITPFDRYSDDSPSWSVIPEADQLNAIS